MEYRVLGKTGLKVSRLCFGALTIGPLQSNLPINDGAKIIKEALNLGVNFIDTADLYGTYPYIREAIRGRDEEVIISSKSYDYEKAGMAKSLERARKELDRDKIDIFLLHEQESHLTLKGHWEALEYLLKAKDRGWVDAVGLSTHHVEGVLAGAITPEIEVIHPLINLSGVGIADGTVNDMLQAIKKAYQAGKGLFGMKPLGGGNLLKERQQALEFILDVPELTSVAVGMQSKDEVRVNCKIFSGQRVSQDDFSRVDKVPRRLHIDTWCQGCGSCIQKCSHNALTINEGKAIVNSEKCVLCGYCGAACPDFAIKII